PRVLPDGYEVRIGKVLYPFEQFSLPVMAVKELGAVQLSPLFIGGIRIPGIRSRAIELRTVDELEDAPESEYHQVKRSFLLRFLLLKSEARRHRIFGGVRRERHEVIQAFFLPWIRFPDSKIVEQSLQ